MTESIKQSNAGVFATRKPSDDASSYGTVVLTSHGRNTGRDDYSRASPVPPKRNSEEKKPSQKLEDRWHVMFERLVRYKEKHGDCLVPNRYKKDPQLGAWVSSQRSQYRRSLPVGSGNVCINVDHQKEMDAARVKMLEGLGFAWESKDPRQVPWATRFEELVEFKRQHGHCLVPMSYKQNPKLANWVSAQRQEGKLVRDGRHSRLSSDKIEKLSSIGFVWRAPKGASSPRKRLIFQARHDRKREKGSERSMTVYCNDDPNSRAAVVATDVESNLGARTASILEPTVRANGCLALGRGYVNRNRLSDATSSQLLRDAADLRGSALPALGASLLAEAPVDITRRQILQEQRLRDAILNPTEYIVARSPASTDVGAPLSLLSVIPERFGILELQRAAAMAKLQESATAIVPASLITDSGVAEVVRRKQPPSAYSLLSRTPSGPSLLLGDKGASMLDSADLFGTSIVDRALLSSAIERSSVAPLLQPTLGMETAVALANPASSLILLSSNPVQPQSTTLEQAARLELHRRLRGTNALSM